MSFLTSSLKPSVPPCVLPAAWPSQLVGISFPQWVVQTLEPGSSTTPPLFLTVPTSGRAGTPRLAAPWAQEESCSPRPPRAPRAVTVPMERCLCLRPSHGGLFSSKPLVLQWQSVRAPRRLRSGQTPGALPSPRGQSVLRPPVLFYCIYFRLPRAFAAAHGGFLCLQRVGAALWFWRVGFLLR